MFLQFTIENLLTITEDQANTYMYNHKISHFPCIYLALKIRDFLSIKPYTYTSSYTLKVNMVHC